MLAKYLDDWLPLGWEIYVQPFMNGLRPDIIILHPRVGLMFFEVKDWNLHHYEFAPNNKPHQYYVRDDQGLHPIANPRKQVERYRDNLINLYAPYIRKEIDRAPGTLHAFRIGLYFHRATTEEALRFAVSGPECIVIGHDALVPGNLKNIVPNAGDTGSNYMHEDWVEGFHGLRAWLSPPFHDLEQNDPLYLNEEQKHHAEPAVGQHQRLRGPAGSGKTLVLAQRAANIAAQGRSVLVVTYNITLWHYIRDMVKRTRNQFSWQLIEFTHFHGFCQNFLDENGEPWPMQEEQDSDSFLDDAVPSLVAQIRRNGRNTKNREYDAVLIDEGQDFPRSYYETLCLFLRGGEEVFFIADYRQNVYKRETSWLDAMTGTKFRGRWRELKESYRLPAPVVSMANKFAERFLRDGGASMLPAQQFSLFDPCVVWTNVVDFAEAVNRTRAVICDLMNGSVNPTDIVILVPTHKDGLELVHVFEAEGFHVNHVFEEDPSFSKRRKRAFWMLTPELKACTIHSFKGWEIKNVIVITPDESYTLEELDFLLYIAITRTRQNLFVFNRHPRYAEFGSSWSVSTTQ